MQSTAHCPLGRGYALFGALYAMMRQNKENGQKMKKKTCKKKSTKISIDLWSSPMMFSVEIYLKSPPKKNEKKGPKLPKRPEMARNDAKIKKMGFFRKGPSEIF